MLIPNTTTALFEQALTSLLNENPRALEAKNEDGQTPLLEAASMGHAIAVKALLRKHANIGAVDKALDTVVHAAFEGGLPPKLILDLKTTLAAQTDVPEDLVNIHGQTPLFYARSEQAVKLGCKELGFNPHQQDRQGNTALLWMMKHAPSDKALLALLDQGADPDHENDAGESFTRLLQARLPAQMRTPPLGAEPNPPAKPISAASDNAAAPSVRSTQAPELGASGHRPQAAAQSQLKQSRTRPLETASPVSAPRADRWVPIADPPLEQRIAVPRPRTALPEGEEINLVADPSQRISDLSTPKLDALAQALGLAPLPTTNTKHAAQVKEEAGEEVRQALRGFLRHVESPSFLTLDLQSLAPKDRATWASEHIYTWLGQEFTAAERKEVLNLAKTAGMHIHAEKIKLPYSAETTRLHIFFGGAQATDLLRAAKSIQGGLSNVDKAAQRLGDIFAAKLKADDPKFSIQSLMGASMGGASAQIFHAALGSKTDALPSMLLLDPQLLTDAQKKLACGQRSEYDWTMPRGVALCLDHNQNPRPGLTDQLKNKGFGLPGLVQLKLGLNEADGSLTTNKKPRGNQQDSAPPKADSWLFGYHNNMALYKSALTRFIDVDTAASLPRD